jgi:hypothetical protein
MNYALEQCPAAPIRTENVRAYGVDYKWIHIVNSGDLFVTRFGEPWLDFLHPEHWYDNERYRHEGQRQSTGIGAVYRVPVYRNTRQLNLVVKFSRLAQKTMLYIASCLPEGMSHSSLAALHINNPFEEFGLLFKLRSYAKLRGIPVLTKRPLAIFSPQHRWPSRMFDRSPWRFERCQDSLARNQCDSPSGMRIDLDVSRNYILIFQWVKGENAWDLHRQGLLTQEQINEITLRVQNDLAQASFRVLDHKPQHIILRRQKGGLLKYRDYLAYALVDFEMLEFKPGLV